MKSSGGCGISGVDDCTKRSSGKMQANGSQPLHNPPMTGALEHTHRPVLQSTTTDISPQSTHFAQTVVHQSIQRSRTCKT